MESCKNELLNSADMIALVTEIPEFLTLVFQRLNPRPLFLHKPVGQIVNVYLESELSSQEQGKKTLGNIEALTFYAMLIFQYN